MPTFTSSGVEIAFDDQPPQGEAQRTMVLVHGFTSNRKEGWRRTGWYAALERRGARCVALDQRGHGESQKLYEPDAYRREALGGDVIALLDHLELGQVDLFGYSMGARTALAAALAAPDRIGNLILGGVGERLLEPRASGAPTDAMAQAMLAEDPETISHPMLRSFRHFADEQGEDRRALAAFVRAENPPLDLEAMGRLPVPVLVIAGQRDEGAGDPDGLARAFPEGRGLTVVGCDHFSAIPHALTKAAVFDFLDGLLDDPFADRF
ncbi:MAG: alpha/beta fold hydrolase [Phenylobacterium sp.]|uniref:alpha/beta fold hydrolase n=1 Tax=Phenylobacterium sp. TaxID=1871053 RepID=UPI002731612C|nr:alpha/beta fold hydrolase [Phenylobacterium sp.]MDP1617783.1 alpha/beta fold hydrolase [Phenylobacterium sp.]MDP1986800.1 alpha/beta fold hydrolase [Phenylobacterium sp.]MDP3382942.1 alpha/beta fold hydrolase [Phenylobacterium sp.]